MTCDMARGNQSIKIKIKLHHTALPMISPERPFISNVRPTPMVLTVPPATVLLLYTYGLPIMAASYYGSIIHVWLPRISVLSLAGFATSSPLESLCVDFHIQL